SPGHAAFPHRRTRTARERLRGSEALLFDDDRRPELDAVVDPDDVGVPHADASVADGAAEKLRVWGAMDPERPSVTVREPDPALAERIRRPRGNPLDHAQRIHIVDLEKFRVLDHLLHLVLAGGRLPPFLPDRDRKRLERCSGVT